MSETQVDATFLAFQEAVVGRYSLERELGRGGMGIVYLAREVRLDRLVAIKLLPPALASQAALRGRFMREATTAARLSHPNIVPIHAVDEAAGFVFIVMAYVDGETLAQRVSSRGPMSAEQVTRLLREVSWALAYAHAQGVVHRDVKPGNILLERGSQRALVADFGIARSMDTGGETMAGELLGTPEFMSPEQAAGEPVDGRSDLYSLGVVGYYAVSGALPFTAPSAQAVLAQHITRPAPTVAALARGAPRSLTRVIDRCLEKDPAARFATGELLADELAPSLVRSSEVPVPIRVFLDRRRMAPLVIPAVMVVPLVTRLFFGGAAADVATILGLLAVATAIPAGVIIKRLRTLLRLGYGPDDIVAGARLLLERRREELQFEHGLRPSVRERIVRVVGPAGLAVAAGSLLIMATTSQPTWVASLAAIGFYVGVPATVLSARWSRIRNAKPTVVMKLMGGRIGRAFARIAGFRLGQRSVPEDRPTELAIAMTAEGLFRDLPSATRKSLGDVPEVLHGLEAHARAARARIAELDAALSDVEAGAGRVADRQDALTRDLRATRAAAEARLGSVVTALESLRLDLLRLRAGAGTVEGITSAVDAARELSESADRLLEGAREVDAVLADTPA